MKQQELDIIIEKHKLWLRGYDGNRAILKGANLTGLDLQGAYLTGAYLAGANLTDVNLRDVNLRKAYLTHALLTGAILEGAILDGVDLRGCEGNDKEIRNINGLLYPITYTKDILQIGCEKHTPQEWYGFTDDIIDEMDVNALYFWQEHKEQIFKHMQEFPAV